jgi:hypothetical protein
VFVVKISLIPKVSYLYFVYDMIKYHQLYLRLHLPKHILMSLTKEKPLEYFTPESGAHGLSYGQWTAKWWQWLISIASEVNPALDEIGNYAGMNQNDPNVWFLAGTLGGKAVERNSIVPAGKSILFPVINYEMNPLEKPELETKIDLIKHVKEDIDDILNLEAIIDGQRIPIFRVQSEPELFTLKIPENNIFQVPSGGTTQATSDGYWIFLKPLGHGNHEIYFAASCSAGSRNVKTSYHLTVTE